MAIAFRSAQTAANGAAPVSLTVTKPAGVVDGDVMVAFVTISADKTISAAPGGWTQLDSRSTGTATGDCLTAVWWKVASSEGSSYVWDFSGGADAAAAIVAYSGVSTSAPVQISGYRLMSSSATAHTAPSVTTFSDDTVTISAYGTNPVFNGDLTFTTPSGLTVRAEADPGAGTTNRAVLKVFDKVTASAGSTGDKLSTINNSAKGVGFTVTVAPLVAAPLSLTVQPYRATATNTGCMIGWYDGNGYAGTNGLGAMETLLQTSFSAVRVYNSWWPDISGTVNTAISDGRLVVSSHKPPKEANAWINIARGNYDSAIDAMVTHYKALAPTPIVFVFHHEPHDSATGGSSSPTYGQQSDFVAAYRRIAKAFHDANAANVYLGYCAIDSHADDYPNDRCYPGDDVVDVLCHDVYNWGTYDGHVWKDPSTLFAPFVTIAKAVNKPWIMGEVACHPDASPHDRGQWFRDLATYLKTGDAATYVLGFCYYHVDNHPDAAHPNGSGHYWRFAQGAFPDARQDFIDAISGDSHFLATPIAPSLTQATAPPPTTTDTPTPPSVAGTIWGRRTTVDGVTITEGSGLASSPKGGAWCIRDSGNPASLYWLTQVSRGTLAANEVKVTGATNGDWEDCFYSVESGTAYVYIHDNRDGNSTGALPRRLYKVAEPATPSAASSVALTATYYWSFPGSASSSTCGSQQNCEAVFIFKGTIYAVQKTDATEAEVYRLDTPGAMSTNSAAPTMGVKVGTIACHCPSAFSLSADGTQVLAVQHGQTKIFRGKGDTIASLLTGKNTLIFSDSPGGSGEGADWFPYQSSDFLVISEDKQTFDYDVSVGTLSTSGIPSNIGFGTPTVTLDSGPITILSAGAIPSPGDFESQEESPGQDFGLAVVSFSSPPTPGVGPYTFEPPIVYDVPRVLPETTGVPFRLMRHYSNLPRGRSVLLVGGHYRSVDNPTMDDLAAAGEEGTGFFMGGHLYVVTTAVGNQLIADGYTVGMEPTPRRTTWDDLRASRWSELRSMTWETI